MEALRTIPADTVEYLEGVCVQAACGSSELAFVGTAPGDAASETGNGNGGGGAVTGGLFTSAFCSKAARAVHGLSARTVPSSTRLPPVYRAQTPCAYAKWDPLSHRRNVIPIGPEELRPRLSVLAGPAFEDNPPLDAGVALAPPAPAPATSSNVTSGAMACAPPAAFTGQGTERTAHVGALDGARVGATVGAATECAAGNGSDCIAVCGSDGGYDETVVM